MNKKDIKEFFDHPVGKVFLRTLEKRRLEYAETAIKGKIFQVPEPNNELNRLIGKVALIDEILSGKFLQDEEFEL